MEFPPPTSWVALCALVVSIYAAGLSTLLFIWRIRETKVRLEVDSKAYFIKRIYEKSGSVISIDANFTIKNIGRVPTTIQESAIYSHDRLWVHIFLKFRILDFFAFKHLIAMPFVEDLTEVLEAGSVHKIKLPIYHVHQGGHVNQDHIDAKYKYIIIKHSNSKNRLISPVDMPVMCQYYKYDGLF